jgi:hypothetical protein
VTVTTQGSQWLLSSPAHGRIHPQPERKDIEVFFAAIVTIAKGQFR